MSSFQREARQQVERGWWRRYWRSPFLVKKWAEPFGQRVRTYVTHPEPAKAGSHPGWFLVVKKK